MIWHVQVGRVEDPIAVYDGASAQAAVAAVLVAVNGETSKGAQERAREAWERVRHGQSAWETTLCDEGESPLILRDALPAPQYDKRCDGLDSWGDHCGRYMNHRGDCDSGRH